MSKWRHQTPQMATPRNQKGPAAEGVVLRINIPELFWLINGTLGFVGIRCKFDVPYFLLNYFNKYKNYKFVLQKNLGNVWISQIKNVENKCYENVEYLKLNHFKFWILKLGNFKTLELRNFETLELWQLWIFNFGNFKLWSFWTLGTFSFGNFGTLEFGNFETLENTWYL